MSRITPEQFNRMFPSGIGRDRALKGREASALLDGDPSYQRACDERDQSWWQQQDSEQRQQETENDKTSNGNP